MHWHQAILRRITKAVEDMQQTSPGSLELVAYQSTKIFEAASDLIIGRTEEKWCEALQLSMSRVHEEMALASTPVALNIYMRVYTDACILVAIAHSILFRPLQAIEALDKAIIIAGPSGHGRSELIQEIIIIIQRPLLQHYIMTLRPPPHRSNRENLEYPSDSILCLPSPPSLAAFQSHYSQRPFIIRHFAASWPALQERPWWSSYYLRSVSGPGRIVPVEVGMDYRSRSWAQKLMSWDEFLSHLDFEDQPSQSAGEILYMAQHDLSRQFPALRDDVIIPDYIYASLNSSTHSTYRPPSDADQMLLNMWLGPAGTMSPAHTDPHHNFFGIFFFLFRGPDNSVYPVQVVGQKAVWLAPPCVTGSMYPSAPGNNTSQVDVFSPPEDLGSFPDFGRNVVPKAISATLGPGDTLYFPPGWWHAMQSQTTSFSVSIWF